MGRWADKQDGGEIYTRSWHTSKKKKVSGTYTRGKRKEKKMGVVVVKKSKLQK